MERDEAIRVYSVNRQLAEENRELAEENRRLALSVAKLAEDRERLEREIEDWKDKLDASEITHEATRADLRDCKRELEQERQDRKQADLDTIRALGERNDARKLASDWQMLADLAEQKLQQERQLADRLAKWLGNALECDREGDPIPAADIPPCREALADWANSRNEPARFWVPGESCPDCGNDLSVRDHGDGRVYDGDECRCCQCDFSGYMTVHEDGEMTVNAHDGNEAVNPP